jgi:hypothetical protein
MSAEPVGRSAARTVAHPTPVDAAIACGCAPTDLPASLLELHVELDAPLPTTTLGVGFDLRTWRAEALARHIIEWIPDFALRGMSPEAPGFGRMVERLQRGLQATFGDKKDLSPAAEVLLHAVCRELYGSSTVVNKVVFKTADNDTYKGFDAVHTVHATDGTLELWLGEAKFFAKIKDALRSIAQDLEAHLSEAYLRNEFAIVAEKIDPEHPHAEDLQSLMHPNRRIDDVFPRIVIPAFVTYDSAATTDHDKMCPEYIAALLEEAREGQSDLINRIRAIKDRQAAVGDPMADFPLEVRLFLLPMAGKAELVIELGRLLSWVR